MMIQLDHKYTIDHEKLNWQEVQFITIFIRGNIALPVAPDSTVLVHFSHCFMCPLYANIFRRHVSTASKNISCNLSWILMTTSSFSFQSSPTSYLAMQVKYGDSLLAIRWCCCRGSDGQDDPRKTGKLGSLNLSTSVLLRICLTFSERPMSSLDLSNACDSLLIPHPGQTSISFHH